MEVEIYSKTLDIAYFIENYVDLSLKQYCLSCDKYKNNWSCPPNDVDTEKFLKNFKEIICYGQKIIFSKEEIQRFKGEDLSELFRSKIYPIKEGFFDKLLDIEGEGYLMSSGYCSYCEPCFRSKNLPCPYPEKSRISMDSFGINIVALAENEFDVSMKWKTDSLPDYYFLINGILRK